MRPSHNVRHNVHFPTRRDGRFLPYHRQDPNHFLSDTFDLTKVEEHFTSAKDGKGSEFSKLILRRNQELSPSAEEQAALTRLHRQVSFALDNLSVASSEALPLIEDKRLVGSYKKGTMIKGHNILDIVVIFKDHPNLEDVERLGKRVVEILLENATDEEEREVEMVVDEEGTYVDIVAKTCRARLLVATGFQSIKKSCPANFVNGKRIMKALTAIQHARWFDEKACYTNIRTAVMIFKDLRRRIPKLASLSIWLIELLAHFAAFDKDQHLLEVGAVVKRMFKLLASGIFLPGSASIIDPCQNKNTRINNSVSFEEQDKVTCVAQTLLRLLYHGYSEEIFFGEDHLLLDAPISLTDVKVTPSLLVHNNVKESTDSATTTTTKVEEEK